MSSRVPPSTIPKAESCSKAGAASSQMRAASLNASSRRAGRQSGIGAAPGGHVARDLLRVRSDRNDAGPRRFLRISRIIFSDYRGVSAEGATGSHAGSWQCRGACATSSRPAFLAQRLQRIGGGRREQKDSNGQSGDLEIRDLCSRVRLPDPLREIAAATTRPSLAPGTAGRRAR